MDRPDPAVTWHADTAGLRASQSTALRSAVATAEHCLQLWSDFATAVAPDPLHITVTVTGDANAIPVARPDGPRNRVTVVVPLALLQEKSGQLATLLIEAAVPAIISNAEQAPRPEPALVWQATKQDVSYQPPESIDDESPLIMELETLEESDLLLIGRLDGGSDNEHIRRQAIDDYVCRRLAEVGLDGHADNLETASLIYWIVHLPVIG